MAPVDASRLADLRARLASTGDPRDKPFVDFSRSPSTHFARWVLLDTEGYPPLLVFESSYDGSLEAYIEELIEITGPVLLELYGHCEHPPDTEIALKDYLLDPARLAPYAAFYRAYPSRTVAEVKAALDMVRHVRRYLDARRATLNGKTAAEIHECVQDELVRHGYSVPRYPRVGSFPLEWFTNALQTAVGPVGPARLRATLLIGGIALAPALLLFSLEILFGPALDHAPLWAGKAVLAALVIALLVVRLVERIPSQGRQVPLADPGVLLAQEDFVVQNQLTHVSFLKPRWIRRALLRLVLGAIDQLARVTFTQGHLGGISSIHFARWVILDDGRLLFLSNFDGSWDSYLGDFIDKASAGLSGIWSNTKWFPDTSLLIWGGARNGTAFKAWTRAGQVPTQFWYTAYPGSSVQNIRSALKLAEDVFRPSTDPRAGAWLDDLT